MRRFARVLRATVLVGATAFLVLHQPHRLQAQSPALSWDGFIELESGPIGFPAQPDGPSQLSRHAVSADGRFVVFTSEASNIGWGGGGGGWPVVYKLDR